MSESEEHLLKCILRRRPTTLPIALLAAHPDDETIGAGASLHLFQRALLIHATDGAPPDMADARQAGCNTIAAYADSRNLELRAALRIGAPNVARSAFHFVDQCASLHMEDLTRYLIDALKRIHAAVLITHPYEGGHPDHDACAFAAHSAIRIISKAGAAPCVVEMACYHADQNGVWRAGRFIPTRCKPKVKHLSAEEQNRKTSMLRCFGTQSATLSRFYLAHEAFRRAPDYDFLKPPHAGLLNYERYRWRMTGLLWRELAAQAAASLDIK